MVFQEKSINEHQEHFLERLQQRYGIKTEYKNWQYNGIISKNGSKSIGYIIINERRIWVLYSRTNKTFLTCYPPEVEYDVSACLKMVFGGVVSDIARSILEAYLKESLNLRMDFEDDKEAYLWYEKNTMFVPLHMYKYKYKSVELMRIMSVINSVLLRKSKFAEISVVKKLNSEPAAKESDTTNDK